MRNGQVPLTRGIGWVVLLAITLSWLAWWPMFLDYPKTQIHDGPFFHKMLEVARVSVERYHELPLWNPFECGGVPLWDNPQGIAAAPFMWLTLIFGSTRTIELWYAAHVAVGFVCMWLFARGELRLSPVASLVAAGSWAFAGVHHQHIAGGHVVWAAFYYFPLALLAWRRAEHELWGAVVVGVIAAMTMLEGGTYPLPYLGLLLGLETLTRLWPVRRLLPIVRAAGVVLLVTFCLGAMRFLPVFDQLTHHHRQLGPDTDALTWKNLKDVFLVREHDRAAEGQQYVWPEMGDYLGPFVFGLAVLGLFTLQVGEIWLLFLFAFFFSLMLGHWKPWAPWSLLNSYVFPFKSMRVPTRFVVVVTLFMSVFAGLAIDRWPARIPFRRSYNRRAFACVLAILGIVGMGDMMSVRNIWAQQAFAGPPLDPNRTPAQNLHYGSTGGIAFLDTPNANVADLGCWEEWSFYNGAALWYGDVPQARTLSGPLKVLAVDRTVNTFTVDVVAEGPGTLLFNSTYDRGWRSNVGEPFENKKMLALNVPSGSYTIRVRYWPHGLTAGLILSALTAVVLGVFGIRALVRR